MITLERIRQKVFHSGKEDAVSPASLVDVNSIKAPRAGEDTWKPEKLTYQQKLIALSYHWGRVNPGVSTPGAEMLFLLVPSELTEGEEDLWYHGLRKAVVNIFQRKTNGCWSKSELRRELAKEGLTIEGCYLMDEERAPSFAEVIKYLSD